MLEQLTQLVQQYGGDAIVKNEAIPNELNQDVIQQAGSSIFSGLQKIASEGNFDQLAGLFQGNNSATESNPVVQKLSEQLTGDLGQKFGLSTETASGIAGSLIPNVLGSLINKAKDPNQPGFNLSDIVSAISGGNGSSGLMDAISKYGGQFGLDQNNDGKVDMSDAMAAVSKKGGIGGLLGRLFGK